MKPVSYFGLASKQVTNQPVHVLKIEGNYLGGNDRFIQVHDAAAEPADGVEPLKSWPVTAGSAASPTPFFQSFVAGELPVANGLFLCISSTRNTKTQAAELADWQVELTDPVVASGAPIGDLVTGVSTLQVWADASGPKRLCKLELQDSALVGTQYLMLFAQDSPEDGDEPLAVWEVKADMEALTLSFGERGRDVESLAADGKTLQNGCTLYLSTTADVLTKSTDTMLMKAYIK